jgi:hypothetical protein
VVVAKRKAPPIISLTEYDESINFMVYSDSGIGKTTLMGTAPQSLFLGVEAGIISAKRAGSTADLWPINTWADLEEAQRYLRDGGWKKYRWVLLDSLTDMQELLWRHILDKVVKDNRSRDPDLPAIQDHLKMQLMFRRFVKLFCDLPCNVAFSALPMNIETAEGEERVMPLITGLKGALSHYTVGKMSCAAHMKIVRTKSGATRRRLVWEQDGAYIGKDRYGCLAPYTDDLTIPQIEERIESSGTTSRAEARAGRDSVTPIAAARRRRRVPSTTTNRRKANG